MGASLLWSERLPHRSKEPSESPTSSQFSGQDDAKKQDANGCFTGWLDFGLNFRLWPCLDQGGFLCHRRSELQEGRHRSLDRQGRSEKHHYQKSKSGRRRSKIGWKVLQPDQRGIAMIWCCMEVICCGRSAREIWQGDNFSQDSYRSHLPRSIHSVKGRVLVWVMLESCFCFFGHHEAMLPSDHSLPILCSCSRPIKHKKKGLEPQSFVHDKSEALRSNVSYLHISYGSFFYRSS